MEKTAAYRSTRKSSTAAVPGKEENTDLLEGDVSGFLNWHTWI
jgi:hypothetical protein